MAFTNFGYFNQSTVGAPTLSGTDGDLYTLLHYAFTTVSNWTRIFNAGTPDFQAVWQPASGGATPVVCIQDNATASGNARLAVMRLAESASAVTTYADPCPTVAQSANSACNWMKSTVASATTRDYHCVVWETGLILCVNVGGVTDVWETYFVGKCFQRLSSLNDPWPWAILVRNSAAFTATLIATQGTSNFPTTALGKVFMLRNAQGTIKSEYGWVEGRSATWGLTTGAAAAGGGYLGTVDKCKTLLIANGASTTALGPNPLISRLCIPQLRTCLHSNYAGVTMTDNVDDGSHTAVLIKADNTHALWLETSNLDSGFPAG